MPNHDLTLVRVFVDEEGRYGNPLAIVEDAATVADAVACGIAQSAGTSETVFVDDAASGRVRIFVPRGRVPFAGHPLVGIGWFLHRSGHALSSLETDAGSVPLRAGANSASIEASAGRGVPWVLHHVDDPDAVADADPSGEARHDYVWAWENEALGHVRARAFTSLSGTAEDEATGSAAVELCAALGRPLRIRQGQGSLIEVTPLCESVELTGRVAWA